MTSAGTIAFTRYRRLDSFLRPFDRESQNGALRRSITGGTALSGHGDFGTYVYNASCGPREKRKSRLRDRNSSGRDSV